MVDAFSCLPIIRQRILEAYSLHVKSISPVCSRSSTVGLARHQMSPMSMLSMHSFISMITMDILSTNFDLCLSRSTIDVKYWQTLICDAKFHHISQIEFLRVCLCCGVEFLISTTDDMAQFSIASDLVICSLRLPVTGGGLLKLRREGLCTVA